MDIYYDLKLFYVLQLSQILNNHAPNLWDHNARIYSIMYSQTHKSFIFSPVNFFWQIQPQAVFCGGTQVSSDTLSCTAYAASDQKQMGRTSSRTNPFGQALSNPFPTCISRNFNTSSTCNVQDKGFFSTAKPALIIIPILHRELWAMLTLTYFK